MADVPPGLKDLINAAQRALHGDNRLSAAQVAQLQARLNSMQGMIGQINELGVTRRQAMAGGAVVAAGAASGDGLRRPMNAPPGAPPAYGTQPGTSPGITLARYVIVFGVGDGVFVYSGTPKLGNPPIAWMGSGLVDPYENVLPSTTGIAGTGTFQAGDTRITTAGTFVYSSTPALGNLIASITPAGGTEGFGNAYDGGINAYVVVSSVTYAVGISQTVGPAGYPGVSVQSLASAPFSAPGMSALGSSTRATAYLFSGEATNTDVASQLQVSSATESSVTNGKALLVCGLATIGTNSTISVDDNHGALIFGKPTGVTPTPGSAFSMWASSAGTPSAVLPSTFAGTLPLVQTDATTNTNANGAGATRLSAIYTIPAGDLQVGTWYTIEMPYTGTMEATNTLELGLSIDGSSSFTANDTISAAIVGAGVGIHGVMRVMLQCTATGALTGRINAFVDGTIGQGGATATFANRGSLTGAATNVTLDTTVSHTIRINSLWGGSTAGQTVSGTGSRCIREGT